MTKITIGRSVVEQALKAMEIAEVDPHSSDAVYKAIAALRAALEEPQSTHSADCYQWHHKCAIAEVERLRAAPPQRKPLTEVELEMAYRDIWRDLPTDFYRTSFGWIEQGIRYAERAHGIGETK